MINDFAFLFWCFFRLFFCGFLSRNRLRLVRFRNGVDVMRKPKADNDLRALNRMKCQFTRVWWYRASVYWIIIGIAFQKAFEGNQLSLLSEGLLRFPHSSKHKKRLCYFKTNCSWLIEAPHWFSSSSLICRYSPTLNKENAAQKILLVSRIDLRFFMMFLKTFKAPSRRISQHLRADRVLVTAASVLVVFRLPFVERFMVKSEALVMHIQSDLRNRNPWWIIVRSDHEKCFSHYITRLGWNKAIPSRAINSMDAPARKHFSVAKQSVELAIRKFAIFLFCKTLLTKCGEMSPHAEFMFH